MTKTISAQTLLTRELLARRRPGYSLEAPFYLSDTLLQAASSHALAPQASASRHLFDSKPVIVLAPLLLVLSVLLPR